MKGDTMYQRRVTGLPEGANAEPCQPGRYSGSSRPVPGDGVLQVVDIRDTAIAGHSRLANRMREQLWRYYPQMLELADDLAADGFLDLWSHTPTPAKAVRLRETTIERFVKAHRLRRWQAPEVLRILKQKPSSVAPGVVEAR